MIKFIALTEVSISEERLKQLDNWGVDPLDYIRTQATETMKEQGIMTKCFVSDCYPNMYEELTKTTIALEDAHILNELEDEILNKACVNGNCED